MGNCKLICLGLGQGTKGGAPGGGRAQPHPKGPACEGEEQDSPGEGSGPGLPLPSLLDLDGWTPARAQPGLHPAGRESCKLQLLCLQGLITAY